MKFELTPIAFVQSCYKEKFATPRQPGLVSAAKGEIKLLPPYNHPDTILGLQECSHVWLQFIFHECVNQGWKPKVRPPRLGGNKKMGVFATRATHRPNGLGLSVVTLDAIETTNSDVILHVSGLDLIDGTPILDIKPYIPYSDSIESASYPFAQVAPKALPVNFSAQADEQLKHTPEFKELIQQVLAQDPKPAFHKIDSHRIYGTNLDHHNITWSYQLIEEQCVINVENIEAIKTR